MKKPFLTALILMTVLCYSQVGINTENPDSSSALDIESTSGGLLIPRLTETQRDAISSPATGLMIYQIDQVAGFYFFNGSVWAKIGGAEEQDTLTDQDGNSYETSPTGPMVWMAENANISTYRDGTPIPEVTDNTEWFNLTTGAWCYFNNDPVNEPLGKIYNWYALNGVHDNDPATPNKKFAPVGWRVPTVADYIETVDYLIRSGHNFVPYNLGTNEMYYSNFDKQISKAMVSSSGWAIDPDQNDGKPGHNQELNNSSGLNIYPYGGRNYSGGEFSLYNPSNGIADLYTISLDSQERAYNIHIGYQNYNPGYGVNPKWKGYYVRLVKY